MKLTLFASKDDRSLGAELLKALKESGIEARGFILGSASWERDADDMIERLGSSTHSLLIEPAAPAYWPSFVAGFCAGRKLPLIVMARDGSGEGESGASLPKCGHLVERARGASEALEKALLFKESYALNEARNEARNRLLELGVSFNQDSLTQSVKEGKLQAVSLFMDAGFSPDSKDKHGVTMLCAAIRASHGNIMRLLLERGANIDLQSEDRLNSPVMDATAMGSNELLAELLQKKPDLNLRSKDGQTALVIAVGRNDAEAVRLLVEAGADPDIEDKLGFTARKYAKLFHNPAIVALIDGSPAA